jgi:hypothetical protein
MANGINMSNSTVMNPTHTYLRSGNYTVNLTVSNAAGSDTKNRYWFINVTNATDAIGVYRNGYWYLDTNDNGRWEGPPNDTLFYAGGLGNQSIVGDWNGNGKDKIGIFNNGKWYLDYNGNGAIDAVDAGYPTKYGISFGLAGDLPISGYWGGSSTNAISSVGVFRPSTHRFYLDYNGNGVWEGPVTDRSFNTFGLTGDLPIAGDWNNDGTTEIGVYRPSTHMFYLDYNGNGVWEGPSTDRSFNTFGLSGDLPIAGDWNHDGTTEIGVFRPSTHMFYLDYNGNGVWEGPVVDRSYTFGLTGDTPVIGNW